MKKPSKPDPRGANGIHLAETPQPAPTQTNREAAIAAAVEEIFQAMPQIVGAVIAKAKEGRYLHANFLFSFAAADDRGPEDDGDDDEQGDGGNMVDFLMKRLDAEAASEPHRLKSTEGAKTPVNGRH